MSDFQRYYLKQHHGLNEPAAPQDTAYDLYLKKTLGRILPQVVQGCLDVRPRDPIAWLSNNLRMASGDQSYIKQVLIFQKRLRFESRDLTATKMKTKTHLNSIKSQLVMDDIGRKDDRNTEKNDLKWCLQNKEKLMEMCKAQCGVMPDDISWEMEDLKECTKNCLDREIKAIRRRLSIIRQEEKKEEREMLEKEKLQKRSSIPNLVFRRMALRMVEAHKKERLLYDKEHPDAIPPKKTSASGSAKSEKGSGKTSGEAHRGEHKGDDDSDDEFVKEINFAESLPTLPPSLRDSFLEALAARPSFDGDIEQLKAHRDAKVKALRQLQMAMIRGDYSDMDEEERVKIYASPSFQAIGLVPPYKLCKLRKLLFEAPTVWEAEMYDCSVFYEPELYIRCPGEMDDSDKSLQPSIEMGPDDYAKPANQGKWEKNTESSSSSKYKKKDNKNSGSKTFLN